MYEEYIGVESDNEIHSTPAYTGSQAAEYILRRVPPVGVDLEISIDRFELDEESDEQTFEVATWTIRICFLDTCETKEEFSQFIQLMEQVEGTD